MRKPRSVYGVGVFSLYGLIMYVPLGLFVFRVDSDDPALVYGVPSESVFSYEPAVIELFHHVHYGFHTLVLPMEIVFLIH